MKQAICAIVAVAGLFFAQAANAQDKKEEKKDEKKKKTALMISNNGLSIERTDSTGVKEKEQKQWSTYTNFDIGVNMLQDNTNYNDPAVKSYLNVPASKQNSNLFKLRQSKSININIYPYLKSFRALKTAGQKIYITTGIGMQIYNFRYEDNISYTRNPSTIVMDTLSFSKNKVGIDYLNIPLMFTFKTRLHTNHSNPKKSTWLVYGAGITEGYNIASWTKQKSSEKGKVKMHDDFSFSNFNTCVTAEIGIENILKLYGSYQVTSLYSNGIDQHPICIGIRIGGI